MCGCKTGYYSGDPLRLTEDCQFLRPTLFPSVPRLYNRIFTVLNERMKASGGIKFWLAQKAISTKLTALSRNASYTHGCYDAIVFKKIRAALGGRVRMMVTGSAPIDPKVLNFFKVCFCCPVLEGYGLTESSAATCVTMM